MSEGTGHLPTTVVTKPGVQSGLLSLSLSAHAALVALVGVCRVASIAPVACLQDDESKPPERRKPLKFMGFFSVENLPLCLHHTLQIHIRDCGEPEIFRNAPHFPPKNEKTSNRFGTKPTFTKLHYVNNIASLIQTNFTFNLLTRKWKSCFPYAMLRFSSNWQVPKFMILKIFNQFSIVNNLKQITHKFYNNSH